MYLNILFLFYKKVRYTLKDNETVIFLIITTIHPSKDSINRISSIFHIYILILTPLINPHWCLFMGQRWFRKLFEREKTIDAENTAKRSGVGIEEKDGEDGGAAHSMSNKYYSFGFLILKHLLLLLNHLQKAVHRVHNTILIIQLLWIKQHLPNRP